MMQITASTQIYKEKRKIANKTALEIENGLRYETVKFYDTIRFALLDKLALQTPNVVI